MKRIWKAVTINFFVVFLNVSIALATAGTVVAFFVFKSVNIPKDISPANIHQTSIIYDRTGEHVLYEIHGEENRKILSHGEIPDFVRAVTIAAEDNDFYRHKGVDPKAILRAFHADIKSQDAQQGGSTITQQLVRNLYLSREKTILRKIIEAILAIKLERVHTKDEILDMYLNEVPYGSNAYGIQTAAETFFAKDAKDLTLDEAAFLAALPKAPTFFSPYGENVSGIIARQNWILDRTRDLELIDRASFEEAKKNVTLTKIVPRTEPIEAPHFVFYAIGKLEEKYGREMLEQGGLRIHTSLDYDMQKLAEEKVRIGAERNRAYGAENAALIALDPKTGEILSMVGSRDFFDPAIDAQVNVATRERQPGSSFKPFAYAEAFLKGYEPESLIADVPTDFGPDGSGSNYIPRNYDGKFHGVVTMREALAMSLNIPAVKTLYLAGVSDTINLARAMGITTLDSEKNRYGLSLVLGGGAVTLLDETAGYAVFANDGKRNPIDPFLKIEKADGELVYESSEKNIPVLDPQAARKINSILSDNQSRAKIFGPRSALFIPGRIVAAKTGTSQEFRDGWTIGYTPSVAVGVWVGNNDNRPMRSNSSGSSVAAPIWNSFVGEILKKYPDEKFIDYERRFKAPNIDPGGSSKKRKKSKKSDSDSRISLKNPEMIVELQDTKDVMIQRWKASLIDDSPDSD